MPGKSVKLGLAKVIEDEPFAPLALGEILLAAMIQLRVN